MKTPRLTDTHALTRNRARAMALPAPALFLHEDILAEIKERLIEVNRTFTKLAIVTGFPDLWRKAFPDAHIVADEEVLALEPGTYDLVIHAMALHWANDPVGQIIQCKRALQADGLFLAAFFGGQTLHELRACLAEAEAAVTGGLSPRVLPMGEIRDLGGLLQRAGFALPVADSFIRTVHYRDIWHLMTDLRAMGEASALDARPRRPTRRTMFEDAADRYARGFGVEGGRIAASFEMVFLTGWSPHESQQKPLRPGSATHRLADALNAPEIILPVTKDET
ncbi:methyltransferase domain-containing protein [Pseudorhodobacter turbinis]|uniref:Methyltransferase domain-containing protein n=1 Tax=Pseudorhodobacter turbinis TaxID=2500533 RepID=A0A4P8EEU8_9RHOB|nr:methyltransferase domain-containing protein [Pseudorhodobacter turbinis]QCO55601.1 methyltransferase domain-containing protein [Pseudorhodobacter turbinis]